MELLAGLAALNSAIGIGKAVIQADAALDSATLKARLAEMMVELANAKIAQSELVEHARSLESENSRLRSASADLDSLIKVGGYYFMQAESGSPSEWPACPACLANEKAINFLVQDGDIQNAKCPKCGEKFSPVTCYLSNGQTAVESRNERRANRQSEINAKVDRYNRGHWMA